MGRSLANGYETRLCPEPGNPPPWDCAEKHVPRTTANGIRRCRVPSSQRDVTEHDDAQRNLSVIGLTGLHRQIDPSLLDRAKQLGEVRYVLMLVTALCP